MDNVRSTGAALVQIILQMIVDQPEKVDVQEIPGTQAILIEASVAADDMKRVIGRKGRTAQALRELLLCVGGKEQRKYVLELIEPDRKY